MHESKQTRNFRMWIRGESMHLHTLTLELLANLAVVYNVAKYKLVGDAISNLAGCAEHKKDKVYWSACMDTLQYLVTGKVEKKWSALRVPDDKLNLFYGLQEDLQCAKADLLLLAMYKLTMYVMEYEKISNDKYLFYLNLAKKFTEDFCKLVDETLSNE